MSSNSSYNEYKSMACYTASYHVIEIILYLLFKPSKLGKYQDNWTINNYLIIQHLNFKL